GLAELDLANNAIKTCAPLLALKSLTILDLTGNPLEDASNLAFFTWVTDLRYDGGTK
ncbi:MAG: leucine-rich repeat domain-containing protein, partial [Firmicutes bacterium]|nr:leucine-rich repeat domain-containing protein [Bacillota bacterium]